MTWPNTAGKEMVLNTNSLKGTTTVKQVDNPGTKFILYAICHNHSMVVPYLIKLHLLLQKIKN